VKDLLLIIVRTLCSLNDKNYQLILSDFGLATELKDERKAGGYLYNLTGMTGSPRYMSPGTYRLSIIFVWRRQ